MIVPLTRTSKIKIVIVAEHFISRLEHNSGDQGDKVINPYGL